MSLEQRELVVSILKQISSAIEDIIVWNKDIKCSDDFILSSDGMRNLAATSMLLEAIGEGVKRIDSMTNGELFNTKPEIPWKQIKGMRDYIAHGYFDIDYELVWTTISEDLSPLKTAINDLITGLEL